MTTDQFIRWANAQPPVAVRRIVNVPGPQLRALIAEGKPMLISELDAHPDQYHELRTFRYGHMLGPGVSLDALQAWQREHREHPLPADLGDFLLQVDGVHLWADLESRRAYFGILPLNEWRDVRQGSWAIMFEPTTVGQLQLSYHDNGEYSLVLDARCPEYLWYDHDDWSHPKHVGNTVAELLDFWWAEAACLDPRREGDTG